MYNLKDGHRIREIVSSTRQKRLVDFGIVPCQTGFPKNDSIEFYIIPGRATAEEISELFVELSMLYRMIGGVGINFTVVDAREPVFAHELES